MESDPSRKRRRHGKKSRRMMRPKPLGKPGGQKNAKGSRRKVKATQSFSSIKPSTATISLDKFKSQPAVCRSYLFGLAGVTLLVLFGGGGNAGALSLSLLLPGLALLLKPPTQGLGRGPDRLVLILLGGLLLCFVPQFYWPDPEWRKSAQELYDISLPFTLSVQPWVSLEAWLCALAGFAWLYAAISWPINLEGRKRFYFAACVVVGILAAVVLWGNLSGLNYPGVEDSMYFSYFPSPSQTANFLAVGGVAAFGYAMCALRARQLMPLIGLIVAGLCLAGLLSGMSRIGVLLFLLGIVIWYALQFTSGRIHKGIKRSLPLLFIALALLFVSSSRTSERMLEFAGSSDVWSKDSRIEIGKDVLKMIRDAPLSGHGLGTFAAVFPQYRDNSANLERADNPYSDVLWLTSETGLLGLLLFAGIVVFYFLRCRGLSDGTAGDYRMAAIAAFIIFILHGFVDVSGHLPGTMYFAVLFAALALPGWKERPSPLKPRTWRICGGILVFVGLLWGLSGISGLPLHSKIALQRHEVKIEENLALDDYEGALQQADKWVSQRPLDWRAYFQRAKLTLAESRAFDEAAADFNRARFVEPYLGEIGLEEGFSWIPFDLERTVAAWREAIPRKLDDRQDAYQRMIDAAKGNTRLRPGVARLSDIDPELRLKFLSSLQGEELMKELERDLGVDARLGHFTPEQRTAFMKLWISRGDREAAEEYLTKNGSHLTRPWWLWSLLRMEEANFEEATKHIRDAVSPPEMPEVVLKEVPLERLMREFLVTPSDIRNGTALLQIYIKKKDFQQVKEVTQKMISAEKTVPLHVSYWHAESYFQLQDYIDSWYAYERYLEQLWARE